MFAFTISLTIYHFHLQTRRKQIYLANDPDADRLLLAELDDE